MEVTNVLLRELELCSNSKQLDQPFQRVKTILSRHLLSKILALYTYIFCIINI